MFLNLVLSECKLHLKKIGDHSNIQRNQDRNVHVCMHVERWAKSPPVVQAELQADTDQTDNKNLVLYSTAIFLNRQLKSMHCCMPV